MTLHARHRLQTGALVAFVLGLWLTIFALLPRAIDQRLKAEEDAARPSVEAQQLRNASEGEKTPEVQPTSQGSQSDASGSKEKVPLVITKARITAYHATAAETDATPCVGAMSKVNFCDPPFPIVANNCLKLGTKVQIAGETYTVADRMNRRYGCGTFDVLNGDGLPDYADVIVI